MRAPDIRRLIAPRSIALIGAGAWTDAVAAGNTALGYTGELWRVHPTRETTSATTYFRSIAELPAVPDAAFVAVPSQEAPKVAAALAARGAGGFVCFSAGFSETGTVTGATLTGQLLDGAGALPFFGPNCYGYVNFFDRIAMMPDQIVGEPVHRGVAIICQSGTIALTLMFNERSLPIGFLFTVGNQTRLAVEDLLEILSRDERVSAFGLYIEGIKDVRRFAQAAALARAAGKPIALIKSGRTAAAARTAHSHTGALSGADEIFEAFCRQLGIARCETLGSLCETLKVLHMGGALRSRKVLVMGASGGDMAMTADVSRDMGLDFAPIPAAPERSLRTLLSDRVTIANPFDLHTYLWFDPPALQRVFSAVLHAGYEAVGFMLDCPPEDKADTASFDAVIDVYIEAARGAPSRAALIASLPETLSARTRQRCMLGGVIPLQGQREALEALAHAAAIGIAWLSDTKVEIQKPNESQGDAYTLAEADGKSALAAFGMPVPRGQTTVPTDAARVAAALGFPVAIKATGAHLEHKSEMGGVVLNVRNAAEVEAAAARLALLSPTLLVEEMCADAAAEILVGIYLDEQFGQVMLLGSGGIFAEIFADRVNLLPPWTAERIDHALRRLKVWQLFAGFRGKPAADVPALRAAIMSVAAYATAHLDTLLELDVNPLMVRAAGHGAMAVDALIRLRK